MVQWINEVLRLGPALFIFMELLEPMLLTFVITDRNWDFKKTFFESSKDTFDFIIVGGGSAGSHLANRLSVKYDVLLLEAGGLPNPLLEIPIYAFLLNNHKSVDYAYRTIPQKMAAFGLNNHVSHWPAGKQLGGSSTINGLIYLRGNVQGFNKIAEKTGDGRWSMDNVLEYYKKIEDYNGWFDQKTHGQKGGMGIEKAFTMPITNHLLDAGIELGYRIRDPNVGPATEGFAAAELHTKGGRRSDAWKGTIDDIINKRESLVVRKFAHVTKIIFKGHTAIGVRYERHGRMLEAKARNEVILSAGTIQTPKILMLSGIGPKTHLDELKIRTLVDLPIGQSLQDEYGALMGPFIVDDGYSFVRERDITVPSIVRWFTYGTGVLSSGHTDVTHSILSNHSKSRGQTESPDIQTYVISSSIDKRTVFDWSKSFNFNRKSLNYFEQGLGKDSFLQLVTLSRPKGMGYIKLRDKNPYSSLIINPRYLHEREDVNVLVEGMKLAVKLVEETKAVKKINGHLMNAPFPGCEMYLFKSDEYFQCLARHATITAYKYCGTAPIGTDVDDPGAVVDSHLRVFGVQKLRIVDASVLQLKYTSVNDATVRMLGELASDIILDDWSGIYYP